MILVWSIVFISMVIAAFIAYVYAHRQMPTFLEFVLAITMGVFILSGLIALSMTAWWAYHAFFN